MVTAALVPQNGHLQPSARGLSTEPSPRPLDLVDDLALTAALATGDVTALDELYRRFRPAAYATAFALLSDAASAEDAVHDAFLRIWRSAGTFQSARGSLRSWLLTIVRNTAIDQLRARQIAMRPQARLVSEYLDGDGGSDLFTSISTAADARRLREALQTLPVAQRHVLELAFFAGLTHGEIAARTGAPLGTVKGRVRLGLRRLRQDLADLAA